jgi:hypothetical protein
MAGTTTVSVWTKYNPDRTHAGLKSTVFFDDETHKDFFTIVLRTPGKEGNLSYFALE